MYCQMFWFCTARGSSTWFSLEGPTKVKARKSFLFTKEFPCCENNAAFSAAALLGLSSKELGLLTALIACLLRREHKRTVSPSWAQKMLQKNNLPHPPKCVS